MAQIKIFADNNLYPCEIRAGQHVRFTFLPAGRQTAKGREKYVCDAVLDNDSGRVIKVTWKTVGGLFRNRLVTKHAPLLRRMAGAVDTYRCDDCIVGLDFNVKEPEC